MEYDLNTRTLWSMAYKFGDPRQTNLRRIQQQKAHAIFKN